jgi:hypothetical protein
MKQIDLKIVLIETIQMFTIEWTPVGKPLNLTLTGTCLTLTGMTVTGMIK